MPALYSRMAIDFGTSNTVVAFWNEAEKDVTLHQIPEVSLPFRFRDKGGDAEIPYIPSVIYYQDKNTKFIGNQVIKKSLERSLGTFRWMKAYIQDKKMMRYMLSDGSSVDYFDAAKDFLDYVILYAVESNHVELSSCEIAFTVPIESFEHYTNWLLDACRSFGIKRHRFIDESTSCIFGYDADLKAGDIFFIFDFGGGTLDCSIVKIEDRVERGRGCRVIGKAGCHIGGRTIDGWLYKDLLKRAKINYLDARKASGLIMLEVEKIKERLSADATASYHISHGELALEGEYTQKEMEKLLFENELYSDVEKTIERALNRAKDKGTTIEDIKEVLLVGGSSLIPSVKKIVSRLFGSKLRSYRPYDAVARGACIYLTEGAESLYDHIQHDYAIRSVDPATGENRFIPLISAGTHYPTVPGFKKLRLNGIRENQRFFGIDIYELSDKGINGTGKGGLVQNSNGEWVFEHESVRKESGIEFWMNEKNPTFIEAHPPANKGEKRFTVIFMVDSNKMLLVTVWDEKIKKYLYENYPVVNLK